MTFLSQHSSQLPRKCPTSQHALMSCNRLSMLHRCMTRSWQHLAAEPLAALDARMSHCLGRGAWDSQQQEALDNRRGSSELQVFGFKVGLRSPGRKALANVGRTLSAASAGGARALAVRPDLSLKRLASFESACPLEPLQIMPVCI